MVPVSPQEVAAAVEPGAAQVVRPVVKAVAVRVARLAVVPEVVAVKPDAVALQAAELPGAAVLQVAKVGAPIAVAEPEVTTGELAVQSGAPASPAAARQDARGRIAEQDAAAA